MALIVLMPPFEKLAGNKGPIAVEGSTVGEALRNLAKNYPALSDKFFKEDGGVRAHILIHLDGGYLRGEEITSTPVTVEGVLKISAVMAGG